MLLTCILVDCFKNVMDIVTESISSSTIMFLKPEYGYIHGMLLWRLVVRHSIIDSWYIVVEYNTYRTWYERKECKTLFRLWTHKRHAIAHPSGWAMGHLFWILWRQDTMKYWKCIVMLTHVLTQSKMTRYYYIKDINNECRSQVRLGTHITHMPCS